LEQDLNYRRNKQHDILRRQKILITGATGFIGSHLCERLKQIGAVVHGISRTSRAPTSEGIQWWHGDVGDVEVLRRMFKEIKPDTVFHLASHVYGAPNLEHVLPAFHANLQSTVNLLTAGAEIGCRRMVLTGSLAEPVYEQGEMFPSSPYAAAKWASSAYGRMFHALYRFPVVMARVFMVYGPAQRDLSKLVPYVTLSLLQGKSPNISSGSRMVDWVYVDDVIDGFLSVAIAPDIEGATVDIGSGNLVAIREIVERLEKILNTGSRASFGALQDRPLEPVRIANVKDTYSKIGWKPTNSLNVGLQTTVEWYKEHLVELTRTIGA
jgi:nucleoside-diphosphate-sugar epimerase